MDSWYKVTLTRDDVIAGKGLQLQNEFMALYVADRNSREDALMMDDHAPDMSEVYYYFSPGALRFALTLVTKWGGRPSLAPTPSNNLSKLVGSVAALQSVFSKERDKN